MMSSEFNQQELEACLAQCLKCGGLREILAKAGIPENEPVQLSIKYIDRDVVTDYEIPTTTPQPPASPTEIDFDQEMKTFLNRVPTSLLDELTRSEPLTNGTTSKPFEWTFKSSVKTIVSQRRVCCCPNRDC